MFWLCMCLLCFRAAVCVSEHYLVFVTFVLVCIGFLLVCVGGFSSIRCLQSSGLNYLKRILLLPEQNSTRGFQARHLLLESFKRGIECSGSMSKGPESRHQRG